MYQVNYQMISDRSWELLDLRLGYKTLKNAELEFKILTTKGLTNWEFDKLIYI